LPPYLPVHVQIIPVDGSIAENGIKGDSTLEKLGSLKPAFVKPHGTHTAANSSFLSDGASAALIMSEDRRDRALKMGLKPRSSFKSWAFVAVDPFEDLLLGPTFGAAKVFMLHQGIIDLVCHAVSQA
ncbi:unnamed protein product, partial [Laminaria digitata]